MTNYQVVKKKVGNTTFEILVNPNTVTKYREGKLGVDKTLFSDSVYKNASTGDVPNASELQSAFGTEVERDVVQNILDTGDYQLSAAERKEKVEKKRKEMINYIQQYYVDPKSKTPHPVKRIELALEKIKFTIDLHKPAEQQVQDIYSKLVLQIPLKRCEVRATLQIPHQFLGKAHGPVHQWCKVISEKYDANGTIMEVSMIPGDYDKLLSALNNICKGEYSFDVEGQSGTAASSEDTGGKKKGKKGKKGRKK